jgi:hypothetical protein
MSQKERMSGRCCSLPRIVFVIPLSEVRAGAISLVETAFVASLTLPEPLISFSMLCNVSYPLLEECPYRSGGQRNRKKSHPSPKALPSLSYGPCQTPTLGFCVERHQRIATFTPENFWSVRPSVQKGGRRIQLEWERGRVFDKEIAQVFQRIVVEGGGAQVLEFGSKEERKGRPAGLNTVELLKIASSGLNLGPHHAMQVCTVCTLSSFPTQRFLLVFHLAVQVCAFCGFSSVHSQQFLRLLPQSYAQKDAGAAH